jgi:hypothetical protein
MRIKYPDDEVCIEGEDAIGNIDPMIAEEACAMQAF